MLQKLSLSVMPGFQPYFPFIHIRFLNRFHETVSVLPFRKRRCRSRHTGEWPDWPSVLAGEFPALPSGRNSRPQRNGNGENRTGSYMNGLTANLRNG